MSEQADQGQPAIRFSDIVFAWPRAQPPCLDIPHFEVNRREQVFLHGPSGSGKTSLLSLIGGVVAPQRGHVDVLGTRLGGLSARRRDAFRADNIGFIFQLFNLVPYLSALENILLPCRFSSARRQRLDAPPKDEAVRLATRLDLDSALLSRPATDLSVGQQQRVAAARALIGRPALIIADEPTSALDLDRQQGFLDLLQEECAKEGTTLLFVSHDHRLGARFDRMLALPDINRVSP